MGFPRCHLICFSVPYMSCTLVIRSRVLTGVRITIYFIGGMWTSTKRFIMSCLPNWFAFTWFWCRSLQVIFRCWGLDSQAQSCSIWSEDGSPRALCPWAIPSHLSLSPASAKKPPGNTRLLEEPSLKPTTVSSVWSHIKLWTTTYWTLQQRLITFS